jgi:hypothetical protein
MKIAFWKLSTPTNKKICQSGFHSFTSASFQDFARSQSSGPIPENNLMKKYITFDSVAYSLALLTLVLVASMLCSACVELHERTNQKAVNIFDELEKPL